MEAEYMTDKQFDMIIQMVYMIMDGCDDLEEAKSKVMKLMDDNKVKKDKKDLIKLLICHVFCLHKFSPFPAVLPKS